MHSSSTSAEIYDFALVNRVNVNKIIIFFHKYIMLFKSPCEALIGFDRHYIPFADGFNCSKPKSFHAIMGNYGQLWANSWKYTCLRTMDCLHHVTATCKVLKGLIPTTVIITNLNQNMVSNMSHDAKTFDVRVLLVIFEGGIIGGSKGGAAGAHPAPPPMGSNLFIFTCFS